MKHRTRTIITMLFILLALSACSMGQASPNQAPQISEEDQLATMVSGTLQSQTLSPATESPPTSLLPHTLYFLSDSGEGEGFQVWRLEKDGQTQTQLTREPSEVIDYTVNPVDGRGAYISGNQLLLVNPDGSGRTVLLEGEADDGSDSFYSQRRLYGLAWSHDGRILAYGLNGVNFYDLSSGNHRSVLTNQVEPLDGGGMIPRMLYFPAEWSPDNSKLLVEVGWLEGGTLAIYDLSAITLVEFAHEGIVCCQPAWTADSAAVLVGSPWIGIISPGLWRFDAANGHETVLVPTTSEDETLNMAGWPVQLPSGELQYFYTNLAAIPEGETPLTLVRSGADGVSGRTPLRPETWLVLEAVWSADGSVVAAVQPPLGEPQYPRRGPVVLIDMAGNPPVPLVPSAREIMWGP